MAVRSKRRATAGSGRVLLQQPPGQNEYGLLVYPLARKAGSRSQWEVRRRAALSLRIHPIVRLLDDGEIDWGAEPGPGDLVGYGMHPYRTDDCFQVAIATATQTPVEQVPDLHVDQRIRAGEDPEEVSRTSWERIEKWTATHGLTMRFWAAAEESVPRERWIGVVLDDYEVEIGRVLDHCLVMSRDQLFFDPLCSVVSPPGLRPLFFPASAITYGISFDKKEE